MADYLFFCDETGNSGSRFYHPEQPLYIEGGWIVRPEERQKVTDAVLALEKAAKYTERTKGTSLKKSAPGRAYMRQVCEVMAQNAAPFISIVEKRFAVCAKAVETYYDSEYNPAVKSQELWNPEERQKRAEVFYKLPEIEIERFATAFRARDANKIVAIGNHWSGLLSGMGEKMSSLELSSGLPTLQSNIQHEFDTITGDSTPRGFDSLNMPIVAQVFQTIEQNCRSVDIIHDECASFEPVYAHVFKMMKDARPGVTVMTDGRMHVTGFKNIKSVSFGNSEVEPMLRASDYLVACCSDFGQTAFSGRAVDPDIAKAAMPAIGGIIVWALSSAHNLGHVPKLGELFCSGLWSGKCMKAMMPFMPK
jgi:hypothetical protein